MKTIFKKIFLLGLAFMPTLSYGAASVWTMRNDNNRSSTFLGEKLLTTSNVNSANFGKLHTLAADDQVYTTPLYISDLNVTGGTHNTVFFASANNTVYAYDADSGSLLWSKNLNGSGRPFKASDVSAYGCGGHYVDAAGNMGVVGTPVIDVKTKTLYVVTKTVEGTTYPQRLHALDITNGGAEKFGGPKTITATVNGTGDGGTTVAFNSRIQNQRPGLLLVNNTIYIGESAYCDAGHYYGWVFGYNAGNLNQVAAWNAAPDSYRAGIWQGGQAFAADGSGNIFFATGNGINANGSNGTRNFGESVVKLQQNGSGGVSVASFWTPSNWSALDSADEDQGSAGMLMLPGQNRVVQGGKDGALHLLDTNNLGGLGGAGIQRFQATFKQNNGGWSQHIHGAPIYWNSGTNGGLVYVWGENDFLRTYKYSPTTNFNTTAFKVGNHIAPQIGSGMPGAALAISSHAGNAGSGILWAYAVYDGDANHGTRPGILYAYDADNPVTELWNNRQVSTDDCGYLAKASHPTVIDGKVFLASFGSATTTNSGQVCVYGLKSGATEPASAPPNYSDFAGESQMALNGSAYLNGTALRLTDTSPLWQSSSAFYLWPVSVTSFHNNFSFQLSSGGTADGMTFTIQGVSPYAVGAAGGGLGYGVDPGANETPATGIPKSVAVKFDLSNNSGEGANSTGLFTNGMAPTVPSTALPSGIDLHSGHKFNVAMVYNGTTLTVTITDSVTAASATQNYTVNIPSIVGANTAYVGFTAATGSLTANQDILNWLYTTP